MIEKASWSKNRWIAVVIIAVVVLSIFSVVGSGADYFRCYTWMVMEPERLPKVADYPWTLNPPWLAIFMAPFVSMPDRAGYIVFMAASLAMFVFTAYQFGGKPIPILLSAHMMWILWWGQIEAWGVVALVIGWFGMKRKSWWLIFLALILASFKPQISAIPMIALWWWSGKDRWKPLAAMLVLLLFSLWVWGPWPIWYMQGILGFVGDDHFGPWNASLGLIALPLFIPALLLPMERDKRLMAITATALIVFPYMPYYSTIVLLTFAVPWWAYLFGVLGYFPSLLGTQLAWNAIVLLPISVLIWLYMPNFVNWYQQKKQILDHSREAGV